MFKPKYFLQNYPLYVFALALVLLTTIWFRSDSLSRQYMKMIEDDMTFRAYLLRMELTDKVGVYTPEQLNQFCHELGKRIQTRITVIERNGKVIADSEKNPHEMDNHGDRLEVKDAFNGQTSISRRFSSTLEKSMLYVAVPLGKANPPEYVLRASESINSVTSVLSFARRDIVLAGCIAALVTAIISLVIIHKVSMPIDDIRRSAQTIARGNLDTRIPVPAKGDIKELAEAINDMAEQLKSRLNEQIRQKNERNAILSSMVEGVIALDNTQAIIWMNDMAAHLLNINGPATGSYIYEVQRHSRLVAFAEKVLKEQDICLDEIVVTEHGQDRFLKLKGSILHGSDNEAIGVLMVISDITELKRLENFRRDFVANVSHEIRTPLTAIRGAVETLQETLNTDPKIAGKLMDMITRHCDRLNNLGEDVLCLSALEREAVREDFSFEAAELSDIVNSSVSLCRHKGLDKNITITTDIKCDMNIDCDRQLMEQALINLIDNAIKYSDSNSKVEISTEEINNDRIKISVRDYGQGIGAPHLPRLFERFYRVDKARSRKLGGTGLGLAIVKHIVNLHRGSVDVQSKIGEGSIFTIIVPVKQQNNAVPGNNTVA